MRIVFLHTDFRLYWIPRLKYLGDFLQNQKHELFILEIAGKGSPYTFSNARLGNGNYTWECLFPDQEMKQLLPGKIEKKIEKKLDKISPDIVFAGAIAYPSGATAVKWCRKHRIPVVIFDNARLLDVPRNRLVNWVKKEIYANVDAMLIPAPSHDPDYQFWGIKQFYYGLNVVDNQYWKQLAEDTEKYKRIQQKFKLPDSYLLGIGRQVKKKNWISLLKAYASINSHSALVLIGNGPERCFLKDFIDFHKLSRKILLLDFLAPEDLAPIYRNAECVILPSFSGETWGLTINEAMACGTPVLVSKQCGCCETLCIKGKTGFPFEPVPTDIARALKDFEHLDKISRLNMKENVEKIIGQWDVDRFAQSVLHATTDLCNIRGKGFHSLLSRLIVNLWKGRYRPV